jgi:hypothetical protein
MKKFAFVAIALAMLIAFTGMAMADTGINATPETQGIVTSTAVQAVGTVTETDSIVWQNAYADLTIPPLAAGETAYTMSYTENTLADQGYTSYVKGQSLDTANQVAGTYNFNTGKIVEFIGSETGRMLSDENMVLDGAGNGINTDTAYICPFASAVTNVVPPFCNIIQVGSNVDATLASVTTAANERHVMASGDPGVGVDYSIKVTGFGDTPAVVNLADAYVDAHIQEARTGAGNRAEDLVYSEMSTASGLVNLFSKDITYQSGLRRY